LRSAPPSNSEFRVAAHLRLGVPLTCLKPFINQPLKSNASAPGKFVSGFGRNIKKFSGAGDGGTTATHNLLLNIISAWFHRALIPHRGRRERHPEDLRGRVLRVVDGALECLVKVPAWLMGLCGCLYFLLLDAAGRCDWGKGGWL